MKNFFLIIISSIIICSCDKAPDYSYEYQLYECLKKQNREVRLDRLLTTLEYYYKEKIPGVYTIQDIIDTINAKNIDEFILPDKLSSQIRKVNLSQGYCTIQIKSSSNTR